VKVWQKFSPALRHRIYHLRHERGFARALCNYESVFQEILADLYAVPGTPHRLVLDFGWTSNLDSYDAAAERGWLSGARLVRLSIRWFSDLQGLANAIFRSRDTFENIGQPEKGQFTLGQILDGADEDQENDAAADPLRHEAACVTVEMALAMIVLHEIGHHALGHMELGDGIRFQFPESDSRARKVPADLVLCRQACEIDADRFSFSRVLALAAFGRGPFRTQLVSAPLADHLLSLAVLAHALVIALLHTRDLPLETYESLEHPHPAVRLLASQSDFAGFLAKRKDFEDSYRNAWQQSLRVIRHNADQQRTLSLLANDRPLLEKKLSELQAELENNLRKSTKRYDFNTAEWLGD
jgi:hypothetical protein